jgi:8-hydroxy-5-deazaflavin:NADPH oxidoreductase
MTQKSNIAIIGLGNIGSAVATNLVKGNRAIIIADRSIEKAETLSQKLGALATPMDIPTAIRHADIIVFAVWFNAIKELISKYGTALKGKIIVDPSNPIAPDDKGGFKKIIGANESAGEIISFLLPEGVEMAKAFGTLSVASLSSAAFQTPQSAVLFYATDVISVNPAIEQLIKDTGFEPVRVGGIDQSIRIEVFGDLHEFGAAGKPLTLAEAKEKNINEPVNF